jgi:hypothetical protein
VLHRTFATKAACEAVGRGAETTVVAYYRITIQPASTIARFVAWAGNGTVSIDANIIAARGPVCCPRTFVVAKEAQKHAARVT